jgi:hypothetical protein
MAVKAPRAVPGFADEIVFRPPGELTPYANNSRLHSEAQIEQVAHSIEKYGFNNPILLDDQDVVVAGHARLAAAQLLNLPQVPCVTLGHLNPAERRAYLIADNKIALNSTWDDSVLKAELEALLEEGFDITDMGYETMPDFLEDPDKDTVDDLEDTDEGDYGDVKHAIQIEFDPDDYRTAYDACAAMRKAGINIGRVVLPAILESAKLVQ